MNKSIDKVITKIHSALQGPIVAEQLDDGGTGAYDFHIDPTYRIRSESGALIVRDRWCGGDVEGECYRRHICIEDTPWSSEYQWYSESECRLSALGKRVQDKVLKAIAVASQHRAKEDAR